jgi:stalled ribosome rescue protein Dom34
MEDGLAHLFLVAKQTTNLKAKIEQHIPKKKGMSLVHNKFNKVIIICFMIVGSE